MKKAVVVGSGLIGMLSAYELVKAGWQVELLEKGQIARESSWAGGGILSPLYPWRYPDPITELARWSQQHYPKLVQALHDESGVDPEWTQSGLLMLDTGDREKALEWADRFGYQLEELSGDALRQCEPALTHTAERALWMESVAQVRNPRLIRALHKSLISRGVVIHEETEVTRLLHSGERVSGVVTKVGSIEADVVIIAAGAWSGRLLGALGASVEKRIAIRPVRGQMLLFKGQPGMISRIILGKRHYVIPRRDGRVLVGSTMEEVGFDKSTTENAREELLNAAKSLVPALAEVPVERHWAGLRPGSPIGVPYIGEHPEIKGLFVNSGHFRNGVVMGPASARLLVDMIGGINPILEPAPYAL
mgnify:CR=1 FL=1